MIVIGRDGQILKTGVTDRNGTWSPTLTVPVDPRFVDTGTVDAIAIANGHNEQVVFNVPVKDGTVQPITLMPIRPGLRNEPSTTLGNVHRLDIIDFVDRYASRLGLRKQTPIPAEQGYAPWSPEQAATTPPATQR